MIPGLGRVFAGIESVQGSGAPLSAANAPFMSNLSAVVMRDGRPVAAREFMPRWARFWNGVNENAQVIDLGSGLVTNVGVMALANDFAWAQNAQTLKLSNQHATGTGATAAAATDLKLQTVSTQGGQTPVAGTQSLVSAANSQIYQTVATINYTGTEAVTEWGLHTSSTLSATTGTPFTAATATSGTVTSTPYSASSSSVQGQQQLIVLPGTTTVFGLILSNTTSVLTIPAWYTVAAGLAGATPGATEAFTLRPVMFDHKVFAPLNVTSGMSIQFTYQLACVSGG